MTITQCNKIEELKNTGYKVLGVPVENKIEILMMAPDNTSKFAVTHDGSVLAMPFHTNWHHEVVPH